MNPLDKILPQEVDRDVDADDYDKSQQKRFWIIIGSFTLILSLIAVSAYFLTRPKSPDQYSLTSKDKTTINTTITNFIRASGTWGLRMDKVNNDDIMNIWKIVSNPQSENRNDYFVDRDVCYTNSVKQYISPNSDLDYDTVTIGQWQDDTANDAMASFNTQNIHVSKPTNTGYAGGGNNYVVASIPVSFESVEDSIMQKSNDSDWDGTFNHLQKTFKNTGSINVIKPKNSMNWKITSVNGLNNPFVLTTWNSSNMDYSASQTDMHLVGSYKGVFDKGDQPTQNQKG